MQKVSIVSRKNFQKCQLDINEIKLSYFDKVLFIEHPLSDATARSLLIDPQMQKYGFDGPEALVKAVEHYPLQDLTFS